MKVVSEEEVQQHGLALFIMPKSGCSQTSMQNTAEGRYRSKQLDVCMVIPPHWISVCG